MTIHLFLLFPQGIVARINPDRVKTEGRAWIHPFDACKWNIKIRAVVQPVSPYQDSLCQQMKGCGTTGIVSPVCKLVNTCGYYLAPLSFWGKILISCLDPSLKPWSEHALFVSCLRCNSYSVHRVTERSVWGWGSEWVSERVSIFQPQPTKFPNSSRGPVLKRS